LSHHGKEQKSIYLSTALKESLRNGNALCSVREETYCKIWYILV